MAVNIKNLVPFGWGKGHFNVDRPFGNLTKDMDKVFNSFLKNFSLEPYADDSSFVPSVDISEGDKEIKVSVELPGIDEKDIEVKLTKDTLTIKGEKKAEKEDKGEGYYHVERSYGSFYRTIPLTVKIDDDKVKAEFTKGVLTVTLPKSADAVSETKKIEVKTV
jgi:HSP20 family protein